MWKTSLVLDFMRGIVATSLTRGYALREACRYRMKTVYKLIFGIGLVALVGVGGYVAWQSNAGDDFANLSADTKLTDSQVSELVARVSKFLVVPGDEQPTVVVISGAQQLAAQQSFYKGAKDGDILILYSSRAIIYDVKSNKLVNVGPIVRNDTPAPSGSPDPSASPTATPTPEKITVDVRNGTATAGLATTTANTLKKNTLFTIGKIGDAAGSFKETVVVDLTKNSPGKSAAVAQLAKELNATVVTALPAGEAASTADAVVIIGR